MTAGKTHFPFTPSAGTRRVRLVDVKAKPARLRAWLDQHDRDVHLIGLGILAGLHFGRILGRREVKS